MSEPETILAHAARVVRGAAGALRGRRVVVTAGPTRESIDPVRVVTNRSSGKMGYRVAEAAWERGADVVLISGPVALPAADRRAPSGMVETTKQLEDAVREELPAADVLVMAAAPADFRPSDPSDRKRARNDGALAIPMEPTADILERHARRAAPGQRHRRLRAGDRRRAGEGAGQARAEGSRPHRGQRRARAGARASRSTPTAWRCSTGTARARILPLQSKREVAEAILDAVERTLGR